MMLVVAQFYENTSLALEKVDGAGLSGSKIMGWPLRLCVGTIGNQGKNYDTSRYI